MFEVIIVDDEPLARQSLRYLIDWEAYGFCIEAEAEDGMQALEMLRERHYSLVLTDIRMPRMNGLAFIEQLRAFSDAPAVILSGYDDFEYARQGMRLGVQDFLLKPVDEEDLIALLRKLGHEIAERGRQGRQQRLVLSALRDVFLRKAAHGFISPRALDDDAQLAEIAWQGKSVCVLLIELDSLCDPAATYSEREMALKKFAVRNIVEELVQGAGYVYEESDERFGVVLAADAPERLAEPAIAGVAGRIVESAGRYAKESITIGIGSCADDLATASDSLAAAEAALDAKFLRGGGKVLTRVGASTEREDGRQRAAFAEAESELLAAVRSCDREGLARAAAAIRELAIAEAAPADMLRLDMLGLYVQLYQTVKQSGADPDPLFDRRLGDYEAVMKAKTVDDLVGILQAKCDSVFASMREAQQWQPNKVTAAVMQIVQEQYASNISLRSVARQVYLNPNYLGKLFKAATGQVYNDYVLQVRMEKAKELLLHTDLKVYEIAQQVGYGELDWFYKKFKTYAGVSAGEFRARQWKE